MNLHLLVDWQKKEKFFLETEFERMNITCQLHDIPNYNIKDRENKYRVLFLYLKYMRLALSTINESNKNDILICWNFTTSIACGLLCKVLKKERIILALNIIAHKRKYIGEIFRRKIFSPIMNGETFFITVNSKHYITDYSRRFNVKKEKFFVLNDPIQSNEIMEFNYNQSYIFAGGEAMRDWKTLFESCASVPQISFVCIARKKNFNNSLKIPDNVRLFFDTDYRTFYEHMEKSSLVVISLKSQLPSGLVILLRAALMQKPIIATDTPSISNYIKNGQSGLLVKQGDSKDLAEKILILYNDKELQKYLSSNLLDYVRENHSGGNYSKRLLEIIQQIT